jgi:hypothetical protein
MERWKAMSQSLSKEIDDRWTTFEASQRMEKLFVANLGATDGLLSQMQWASEITMSWSAATSPGVRGHGFTAVERQLASEMTRLRRTGTATPAEFATRKRAFEQWRVFAASLDSRMEGLLKLAVSICVAEQRLRRGSLSFEESNRLTESVDQLRKQFDELKGGMVREADATLVGWN